MIMSRSLMERRESQWRRAHLLVGLIALLGLTGCADRLVERQLIKPTAEEAQACIDRCEIAQGHCEQRQRGREADCQAHYDLLTADLETCRATPGALCMEPDPCQKADLTICKIQYEECVVTCGGRIESHFSLPSLPKRSSEVDKTP